MTEEQSKALKIKLMANIGSAADRRNSRRNKTGLIVNNTKNIPSTSDFYIEGQQ